MKDRDRSVRRSLGLALLVFGLGLASLRALEGPGTSAPSPTTTSAPRASCPPGTLEERGLCVPVTLPR